MSKLLEMRGQRTGKQSSLRSYFSSDRDYERLEEIATWGDSPNSALAYLRAKLVDNHQWHACIELDAFFALSQQIAETERACVKALQGLSDDRCPGCGRLGSRVFYHGVGRRCTGCQTLS
jgi:hypothetical protein